MAGREMDTEKEKGSCCKDSDCVTIEVETKLGAGDHFNDPVSPAFKALAAGDLVGFRKAIADGSYCLPDGRPEVDAHNATALHWCAWLAIPDSAAMYIERYPEHLESLTDQQQTPLMWAILQGDKKECIPMLRTLLKAGARVDSADITGASPLMLAAQYNNRLCALLLLQNGANVDARDKNGNSISHWAAYSGSPDLLYLFKAYGADLNAMDSTRMTVLHRAVQKGTEKCVKMLTSRTNDPPYYSPIKSDVENLQGETALQLAEKYKAEKNIELIKEGRLPHDTFSPRPCPNGFPGFYLGNVFLALILWLLLLRPLTIETHPVTNHLGEVMLVVWLFCIYRTMRLDPGTISSLQERKNLEYHLNNADLSTLTDPDDVCYTCVIEKKVRSKHCDFCDVCVRRFDHHCFWIKNCVGEGNHREFISVCVLQLIGSFMYLNLLYQVYLIPGSLDNYLALAQFWMTFFVNLFSITFAAPLAHAHIYGMIYNMTTNESINWRRYPHFHDLTAGGKLLLKNPFSHGWKNNVKEFWTRGLSPRNYTKYGNYTY